MPLPSQPWVAVFLDNSLGGLSACFPMKVAMRCLHAENQRHTPNCSKEKGFTFERLSAVSANSRCGLAKLTCFMGLLNRCSYYILLHLQILYSISLLHHSKRLMVIIQLMALAHQKEKNPYISQHNELLQPLNKINSLQIELSHLFENRNL